MKKIYSTPNIELMNVQPETGVLLLSSGTGPEPGGKPAMKGGIKIPVVSIPG